MQQIYSGKSKSTLLISQSGFAQILVLGALVVGLVVAVYLVQTKQIFRSKASSDVVTLTALGGQPFSSKDEDGNPITTNNTVEVHVRVPEYSAQ